MLYLYLGNKVKRQLKEQNLLVFGMDVHFINFMLSRQQKRKPLYADWELALIEELEHAELKDRESGRFSTEFGDHLYYSDFSSGTKTLLYVLNNPTPNKVYDITEMGPNIQEYLFVNYGEQDRKLYSGYLGVSSIPSSGIFLNDTFCRDSDAFFMRAAEVMR